MDDLKPWQQQAGESSKAFHAFTHFLSLLPHERSMSAAYTAHLIHCKGQNHTKKVHCIPDWNEWRFRFSWPERAHAHDAEMFEHERSLRVHEIKEMNKRHVKMAIDLQSAVVHRLKLVVEHPSLVQLGPVEMARVLDKAAIIERRARDVATAIVQHQGTPESGSVALDLSKLSDEQLAVFQFLVKLATPDGVSVTVETGAKP